MDTLTHALSGALAAAAVAPRLRGERVSPRIAVAALAAAFPDIDYLASFVSPLAYLLHHRGITHSVLLLPLWAWLLAVLAARAFPSPRGWRAYSGVAALGLGAHIAGDLITSYGTMVFAPLSQARFAWGTTFIIDLWFSAIVVAGLAAALVLRRTRAPAAIACAVLLAYVGGQAWLKSQAIDFGRAQAMRAGLEAWRVAAQPGPVSPFNWMVYIDKEGEYLYSAVNLARREPLPSPRPDSGFLYRLSAPFRPPASAEWGRAALRGSGPDAALAHEAWSRPELGFFRWFAQYPALYRVDRGNPSLCVWFYDLRFFRPGAEFLPFRYGLCRDGHGPWRRFRLLGENAREPLD